MELPIFGKGNLPHRDPLEYTAAIELEAGIGSQHAYHNRGAMLTAGHHPVYERAIVEVRRSAMPWREITLGRSVKTTISEALQIAEQGEYERAITDDSAAYLA